MKAAPVPQRNIQNSEKLQLVWHHVSTLQMSSVWKNWVWVDEPIIL